MLLIRCPYCEEERPELEFRNAGEAHIARSSNMAELSDEDFEKFFFIRSNPKGITFERWRHVHGCARFFNAVRDTVTDKFVVTYKAGEARPDLAKIMPSEAPAPEPVQDDAQEDKARKPAAKKATAKKGDA